MKSKSTRFFPIVLKIVRSLSERTLSYAHQIIYHTNTNTHPNKFPTMKMVFHIHHKHRRQIVIAVTTVIIHRRRWQCQMLSSVNNRLRFRQKNCDLLFINFVHKYVIVWPGAGVCVCVFTVHCVRLLNAQCSTCARYTLKADACYHIQHHNQM